MLSEKANILALGRVQEPIQRPIQFNDRIVAAGRQFRELTSRVTGAGPHRCRQIRRHARQTRDLRARKVRRANEGRDCRACFITRDADIAQFLDEFVELPGSRLALAPHGGKRDVEGAAFCGKIGRARQNDRERNADRSQGSRRAKRHRRDCPECRPDAAKDLGDLRTLL